METKIYPCRYPKEIYDCLTDTKEPDRFQTAVISRDEKSLKEKIALFLQRVIIIGIT